MIEFHPTATADYIAQSLYKVENAGYTPVLAHIERYPDLFKNIKMIEQIIEGGAYIQVNASSVEGRLGGGVKRQIIKMMKKGLVHFVATDAHSNRSRAPVPVAVLRANQRSIVIANTVSNNVWITGTITPPL